MNDLPPIHDEASDTPIWVPFFGGLLLLLLGASYLVKLEVQDHLAAREPEGAAGTVAEAAADAPDGPVPAVPGGPAPAP